MKLTNSAATVEKMMTSRGKYTFLMRLLFPMRQSTPTVIPPEKKFHGSSPQSRNMAKELSPLGWPIGGFTFKKNENTTVKMIMVESGFSIDQVQPRTDFLYLLRSSRSVRLTVSSRASAYSRRRPIGGPR